MSGSGRKRSSNGSEDPAADARRPSAPHSEDTLSRLGSAPISHQGGDGRQWLSSSVDSDRSATFDGGVTHHQAVTTFSARRGNYHGRRRSSAGDADEIEREIALAAAHHNAPASVRQRRNSGTPIELSDDVMHMMQSAALNLQDVQIGAMPAPPFAGRTPSGVARLSNPPTTNPAKKSALKRVMTIMTTDFTNGEEGYKTVMRSLDAMKEHQAGKKPLGGGKGWGAARKKLLSTHAVTSPTLTEGGPDDGHTPERGPGGEPPTPQEAPQQHAPMAVRKESSASHATSNNGGTSSPRKGSLVGDIARFAFHGTGLLGGSSKRLQAEGHKSKSPHRGTSSADSDVLDDSSKGMKEDAAKELARRTLKGHVEPQGIKRSNAVLWLPGLKMSRISKDGSEDKDDVRNYYSDRDIAEELEEERARQMEWTVPLHPYSYLRMLWDALMFLLTIFALISDPISIAFDDPNVPPQEWSVVLDRILTGFFCFDIILNFLTGCVDEKNMTVVMGVKEVAITYAKTWLIIDVCSSLPPEAFTSFSQNSMLKGARVSKLLRCFKISRLARLVQVLQLNFDIRLSQFMWKIIAWISVCVLWLHWASCAQLWVWRAVEDQEFLLVDVETTSQPRDLILGYTSECLSSSTCAGRLYLRAVRTATGYMCGHGQDSGRSYEEDVLVVIATLTGCVLYTAFIAMGMSFAIEMDARRLKHMGKVEMLNHYLGRRAVPLPLRMKVRKFLEVVWESEGGVAELDSLNLVSRSLRRELVMHNTYELLKSVPFLDGAPDGFYSSLGHYMSPETFLEGDDLMLEGEVGQEMFILERGVVDVLDHEGQKVASLGPGSYFGEIALSEPTIRTATMRAATDGMVYTLSRADLQKVLPLFPEVEQRLERATRLLRSRSTHLAGQPGSSGAQTRSAGGGHLGASAEAARAAVAASAEIPLGRLEGGGVVPQTAVRELPPVVSEEGKE